MTATKQTTYNLVGGVISAIIILLLICFSQVEGYKIQATVKSSLTKGVFTTGIVTVFSYTNGGYYTEAKVNTKGQLEIDGIAEGAYDFYISYNTTTFQCLSYSLEEDVYIGNDTTTTFYVSEGTFEGIVIDAITQDIIQDCTIYAISDSMLEDGRSIQNATILIDEKGYFATRIIPAQYFVYITFHDQQNIERYGNISYIGEYYFGDDNQESFNVFPVVKVTGSITYMSDGEAAAGSLFMTQNSISFSPLIPSFTTTIEEDGNFTIYTSPGQYLSLYAEIEEIEVTSTFVSNGVLIWDGEIFYYEDGGYYQSVDLGLFQLSDTTMRIYVHDENFNAVPQAVVSSIGNSDLSEYSSVIYNSHFKGQTDSNGQFDVRIIEFNFNVVEFTPPNPNPNGYISTFGSYNELAMDNWLNITAMSNAPIFTGEVMFSNYAYLPPKSYLHFSIPTFPAIEISPDGSFSVSGLYPDQSISMYVNYTWVSPINAADYFHTYESVGVINLDSWMFGNSSYHFVEPFLLDVTFFEALVVDMNDKPVPNVLFTAEKNLDFYSTHLRAKISVHSDSNGFIRVLAAPGEYINCLLTPPTTTSFAKTPVYSIYIDGYTRSETFQLSSLY